MSAADIRRLDSAGDSRVVALGEIDVAVAGERMLAPGEGAVASAPDSRLGRRDSTPDPLPGSGLDDADGGREGVLAPSESSKPG